MRRKFEFDPLPTVESVEENDIKTDKTGVKNVSTTRVYADMPDYLVEKIKDYAYWDGSTQQEILIHAVNQLFAGLSIKERPEKVKNRPKPGRKPKN